MKARFSKALYSRYPAASAFGTSRTSLDLIQLEINVNRKSDRRGNIATGWLFG